MNSRNWNRCSTRICKVPLHHTQRQLCCQVVNDTGASHTDVLGLVVATALGLPYHHFVSSAPHGSPLGDQPSTTHPITVLLMALPTVNQALHTPCYWLAIYSVQPTLVRPSLHIFTTEPSMTFFMDYGACSGTVG